MKKVLLLLLFIIGWGAQAQSQIIPRDDKFRLGLRIGFGITSMGGDELENARAKRGFVAGVYSKFRFHRNLDFSTGLEASFRGARFRNGDSAYSQIALVYADIPALFNISMNRDGSIRTVLGYQASALLKTSMFIGNDPIAEPNDLPLTPIDHMGVVGISLDGEIAGFNFYIKYSLRNINRNLDFQELKYNEGPNGGDIRNLAFEIAVNF